MSAITLRVEGADKLLANAKKYDAIFRKQAAKAVGATLLLIQETAKRSIARGDKTGHVYGVHTASAPGEAPATDTGNLVGNIDVVYDPEILTGYVIARTPYAARLEFGDSGAAPGQGFIAARPFMRPARDAAIPIFQGLMAAAIKAATKRQEN